MKILKKIIISVLLVMAMIGFAMEVNARESYESDRSNCRDVHASVDVLCWSDRTWADAGNGYDVMSHYFYDDGNPTNIEAQKLHPMGADWMLSTGGDMANQKGGVFGRPRFRRRENIHDGPVLNNGNYQDLLIMPYKVMAAGSHTGEGAYEFEAEGIMWESHYWGWHAVECTDPDNCDATGGGNTDGIQLQWTEVPTSNINAVACSTYEIDDGLCILYTETGGDTTYDVAATYNFLLVVSPAPDFNSGVGSSATIDMYWAVTNGAKLNITWGTFQPDFMTSDNAGDYVNNLTAYFAKEEEVRTSVEKFFTAFNFPASQTEQNISDYYNGVLSFYSNRWSCWNRTDTSSNCLWKLTDESNKHITVNTPNNQQYHGIWVWDSFHTDLGTIAGLNRSHTNAEYVFNVTMYDDLKLWVQEMDKYPTAASWERSIRQYYLDSPTQSPGGQPLLLLNMINASLEQSWSLTENNQDWICGDAINALRSHHQSVIDADTNSDWRHYQGTNNLGRDGTDVFVNSGNDDDPNTDQSNWVALSSVSLMNLYAYCSNSTEQETMSTHFNNTVVALEGFWNTSCNNDGGCYWSHEDGNFFDLDAAVTTDEGINPFGQFMPMLWGNITEARAKYILRMLYQQFVDAGTDSPYTSIPTAHPSYESNGQGSGDTWNGPIWPPDPWFALNVIRDIQIRYGYTWASVNESWMEKEFMELFGIDACTAGGGDPGCTPWGSESYESDTGGAASWGSNPYGWGGNLPVIALNDYNIFAVLSFSPAAGNFTPGEPDPPVSDETKGGLVAACHASPFCVTTSNPIQLNISNNTNVQFNFTVNSTGNISSVYEFNITVIIATNASQTNTTDQLFITIDNGAAPAGVPFYNKTYPVWHQSAAEILDNVNASDSPDFFQRRYDELLTDEGVDDDSSAVGGIGRYWKAASIGYKNAMLCYLRNDTQDCDDAKEFMFELLNESVSSWTGLTVHNRKELVMLAGIWDLQWNNMTDAQKTLYVPLYKAIADAWYDEDVDEHLVEIRNDNGAAMRGAMCLQILTLRGVPGSDSNFTTLNRWDGCELIGKNFLKGFLSGTSFFDGWSYENYGTEDMDPYLYAYIKSVNSTFLDKYNDTFCGNSKSWTYYMLETNEPCTNCGSGTHNIRSIDWGDGVAYENMYTHELAIRANLCGLSTLNWHADYLLNHSSGNPYDFENYDLVFTDLNFWNKSVGLQSPTDAGLSLTINDSRVGRYIERDGWTFVDDLVFGLGGWSVESPGHPQQDDNHIVLYYKYPLLGDGGFRTPDSQEEPAGLQYHNTLCVDSPCKMIWSNDAGQDEPASLHYTGTNTDGTDFPTPVNCPDSTWPNCEYLSHSKRMKVYIESISATVSKYLVGKPYFGIAANFTRQVIYVKNLSNDFFVVYDNVNNGSTNHNWQFGFNSETPNVSIIGQNMIIDYLDSNLNVSVMYNESACGFRAHFENKTKKISSRIHYQNTLNCTDTNSVSNIYVLFPYLDSDTINISFNYTSNSSHHIVRVADNINGNFDVAFSKTDFLEEGRYHSTPAATPAVTITASAIKAWVVQKFQEYFGWRW